MTSYKPYPSSDKPGRAVQAQRPPAPPSVTNAIKLMYAGAAVTTVSLIVSLTGTSSLKSAIKKHFPAYTVNQVNHLYSQIIAAAVITGVFGVLLWLVMAWANGKGMSWARIVSSVLFVLNTLGLLTFFRNPETGISVIFQVLTWLVGLGAIILLWRPDSSTFFKPPAYT